MATHGRSLDDLPLAAYSTGVEPEAQLEEPSEPMAPADPPARPSGPPFAMTRAERQELPTDPDGLAAAARSAAPAARPSPGAAVLGVARRNPRLAAAAGFVAVIAIGLLLLTAGGQAPASLAASASPSVPPVTVVLPPNGDASLVLAGAVEGTYAFTGGARDAAKAASFSAIWTDEAQDTLALDATVDRGTRTTGAGLVLRLTVMVDGTAITFRSEAGECTVGMGVQPTTVSGSFTCKKLKSEDGKLTIRASGTYRT